MEQHEEKTSLLAEAVALREGGRKEEAREALVALGALLGLGSTYRVLGRYEDAVALLTGAAREFPEDGALRTFLAMALYNTGQHHESVRTLLRLLAATSEDPSVRAYKRAIEHYAEDLDATE